MITRGLTWGSLLVCVGFFALTEIASARSDGDRAIFSEPATQLSRFHSLPPAQSSGRLQADISMAD